MAQSVDEAVRASRIIAAGLMGGLLFFAVVAMVVGPVSREPNPDLALWMLGAVALLGVGCAARYTLVRETLIRRLAVLAEQPQERSVAAERMMVDECRRFIVLGGGLIEGPGFLAVVTYLVTSSRLALGVVALALVLLAAHFLSTEALRRLKAGVSGGTE